MLVNNLKAKNNIKAIVKQQYLELEIAQKNSLQQ